MLLRIILGPHSLVTMEDGREYEPLNSEPNTISSLKHSLDDDIGGELERSTEDDK